MIHISAGKTPITGNTRPSWCMGDLSYIRAKFFNQRDNIITVLFFGNNKWGFLMIYHPFLFVRPLHPLPSPRKKNLQKKPGCFHIRRDDYRPKLLFSPQVSDKKTDLWNDSGQFTLPMFNMGSLKMAPWNRRFRTWKPSFLGSMLNFRGVL